MQRSLAGDALRAPVRRVLLPKTETHVFYAVRDGEAVILSVWGVRRKHGPPPLAPAAEITKPSRRSGTTAVAFGSRLNLRCVAGG